MDIKDINFAIEILSPIEIVSHPQSVDASDIKEAFKVAVESLKVWKENLKQEPCEDCISREQAKSAIRDRFKDLPSRVEINTILNDLPSVTPSYNSIKTELKSCDDCISRQAVLDVIEREEFKGDAISEIEKLLSAIPQPKTGHWIRFKEFENGYYHIKCSECGQYWSIDGHAKIFSHCFNCGAKMIESEG